LERDARDHAGRAGQQGTVTRWLVSVTLFSC
jgi:hypothetical protein